MLILKIIFLVLLCIPLIYLAFILLDKLLSEFVRKKDDRAQPMERKKVSRRRR